MWARKRIDIGWRDLLAAAGYALFPDSRATAQQSAEQAWPGSDDVIACLSVRSGLDLMLGQLGLPAGSEVLVSAVTIEDMVTILQHHGLVAVPMDVNPTDMSPSFKEIDRAITSRTKAVLIAHLFGTRLPLQPFAGKAQEHGLLLWEDCAQAFDGRYAGHPEADAVMFSFGPIKTATALGGGLLRVRDRELLRRMRSAQETWPLSNNRPFVSRVARYAVLKFLSGRIACRVFLEILKLLGRDPDRVINSAVRNFPGDELIAQLRHRSPTAMLRLLARRLRTFRTDRLDRRARLGRRLANRLALVVECPGDAAAEHSFWVFPVCVRDSASLLTAVRAAGFDASAGSQLRAVPTADGSLQSTPNAARITTEAVFLPLYPELTEPAVDRLADILTSLRQNTRKV
jgi:dTDP-4-amino-4,6-dideoxygalactose transaminase